MKNIFLLITICFFVLFTSCEQEQPQPSKEETIKLDKHGAVEVVMDLQDQDSVQVLTTHKFVYDDNGHITRSFVTEETLPGLKKVKDTLATGRFITKKDEDGDDYQEEVDTTIVHSKDYQLFITVKKHK